MKQFLNTCLNGSGEFANFAYFFKGDKYTKYNWTNDIIEDGYPMSIEGWNLGSDFNNNIDAAFNGYGANEGKAYFFKGSQYVRYDWAKNCADEGYPLSISEWNLPGNFASSIDAAIEGTGENANKVYFFKDNEYIRYNLETDTVDEGYPLSLNEWKLIDPFLSGVDSVINGKGAYESKTYFFKGSQYMRYDWASDQIENGVQDIGSWRLEFNVNPVPSIDANTLPFSNKVTENKDAFLAKVIELSAKLLIPPKWLMGIMNSESGINHRIVNANGGAVGLIQFMPATVKSLLKTTKEHLVEISNVEQLDYVYQFYSTAGIGRFKQLTDMYLYTFYPAALGRPDDFVIGSEKSEEWVKQVRDSNYPFDLNKDNKITIAEFRQYIIKKYAAIIPDIS